MTQAEDTSWKLVVTDYGRVEWDVLDYYSARRIAGVAQCKLVLYQEAHPEEWPRILAWAKEMSGNE